MNPVTETRPRHPRSKSALLPIWAAPLLLACGGGDDGGPAGPNIGGLYEVTHHTLNTMDCDAEGPDEAEPLYFRLRLDQFFGVHYYALDSCDGPDEASCDFGSLSASFFEPRGDGWFGDIRFSIGGDESFPCTLGLEEALASPSGDDMQIEIRNYSLDAPDLVGDACDPDQVTPRREQMVCERLQVARGRRVSD